MPLISGQTMDKRTILISGAYFFAGFRMGMGALVFFFKGLLQKEFPRYLYLRKKWEEDDGVTDEQPLNFHYKMQREIMVQCFCNMGVLCMPLMIQAFGYNSGDLTYLEVSTYLIFDICKKKFKNNLDRYLVGACGLLPLLLSTQQTNKRKDSSKTAQKRKSREQFVTLVYGATVDTQITLGNGWFGIP